MDTDASADPDGHHDWHSPAYVRDWIDRDVTRDRVRQPLLRRAVALLSRRGEAPLRVLDVGGGYGAFSAEVLEHLPSAQVVLHDYSEAMIAEAKQRLGRFGERVTFRIADMSQPGWADGLGGPFDAAVSALAVHNLGDPGVIRRVYGDICSVLEPGGCFLNLDLVFPTSEAVAALYRRDPTRDTIFGVHLGETGLKIQLQWLEEAGFAEVECVWKDLEESLIWGLRGSST